MWAALRTAVPGILLGLRDAVRGDAEMRAATFAGCRLVRIADDAKLTKEAVNHFRGWRGLTVGKHAEADFRIK